MSFTMLALAENAMSLAVNYDCKQIAAADMGEHLEAASYAKMASHYRSDHAKHLKQYDELRIKKGDRQ